MRTEQDLEKLIDGAIYCFHNMAIPSIDSVKPEIYALRRAVDVVEYFRKHGYLGQAYDQIGLIVMGLLHYKLENLDTTNWYGSQLEDLLEKWEV